MPTGVVDVGWRRRNGHRVDEEGELLSVPLPLSYLWLVLAVLTVLEALNDLFGFAGPHWLYDNWIHNVVLGICAVLVLARAAYEPIARPAWLAFGVALLLWFVGSTAWAVAYAGQPDAAVPVVRRHPLAGLVPAGRGRDLLSDPSPRSPVRAAPLDGRDRGDAAGPGRGVRPRDSAGDGAQDGRAPGRGRRLRLPGARRAAHRGRPRRLRAARLEARHHVAADRTGHRQHVRRRCGLRGPGGRRPCGRLGQPLRLHLDGGRAPPRPRRVGRELPKPTGNPEAVTGMRAVALALFAQALAIGIQLYAIFREVGRSERVVTIVVLVVASVQIILTRPRKRQDGTLGGRGRRPRCRSRNARNREWRAERGAACDISAQATPGEMWSPQTMSRGRPAADYVTSRPARPGARPGTPTTCAVAQAVAFLQAVPDHVEIRRRGTPEDPSGSLRR